MTTMSADARLVRVTRRGSVTLPAEIRRRLQDDALLEVVRRDDGVIELRPQPRSEERDPSQAWFWTEHWQQMEREADENYATGKYYSFDDIESFMANLDPSNRK